MKFARWNQCLCLSMLFLSACMTPSEKREVRDDIFNMQTRLLNLERETSESGKEAKNTGNEAVKRIASTRTELERLGHEIQQIRGDIDALKIGVTTGSMPGASPDQEGTLAHTLAKINERLEALEHQQDEILDAISKAGLKKNGKNSVKPTKDGKDSKEGAKLESGAPAANVADLQKAFDKKRYKQVVDDGPALIKKASEKDKQQLRFLTAESYFKLGKMRDAALHFNEYVESKPDSQRLPLVKMRIGDCFRNLGDRETAKIYYQELIKEFPDSGEAAKAKERLSELSKAKSKANKG